MSRLGVEPGPPTWEASTLKQPSRQLVNSYSELLHMSPRQENLFFIWKCLYIQTQLDESAIIAVWKKIIKDQNIHDE